MKSPYLVVSVGAILALQCAFGQSTSNAGVGITKIVIAKRQAAFGGASFGSAGPYEMVTGTAYGELDPKDRMNAGIVNLQYAPLNARGHVEYSMDITFLKPVDINKGNGRLVYDVLNRGHEKALSDLNLSAFNSTGPSDVTDPATALLMKRGYTVAWSGWEAEGSASTTSKPGLVRAKFPVAIRDGKPITGTSREEFTNVPAARRSPACSRIPRLTGILQLRRLRFGSGKRTSASPCRRQAGATRMLLMCASQQRRGMTAMLSMN